MNTTTTTTTLTEAALLNQIPEILKLLGEGRSIDETDDWGDTALHAAALKGRRTVAKLLLDKGADVNKKNLAGSTPLHKAVVGGNASLIELLLQHGGDSEIRNHAGFLPEDYTKEKSIWLMLLGKAAVELRVPVPISRRGLVIGQGGKTLKRIRTVCGADVLFPPEEDPREEAIIRGRAESVAKAKELIEEILAKRKEPTAARETKDKEVYSGEFTRINLRVPKQQHRLVIGAGGKNVREISKETGARVRVPPEHEDDDAIIIEGSPEAVDKAAERVTRTITRLQETRPHQPHTQENGGGARDGGGGRGRGRGRGEERPNFTLANFLPVSSGAGPRSKRHANH